MVREYHATSPEQMKREFARTKIPLSPRHGHQARVRLAVMHYHGQARAMMHVTNGYSSPDAEAKFAGILRAWAMEDLDGAAAWILADLPGGKGEEWLVKTLKSLAPIDQESSAVSGKAYAVVDFSLRLNQSSGRDIVPTETILQMCLRHAPALATEVMAQANRNGMTVHGVECEFHPNMDFAALGDFLKKQNYEPGPDKWIPAAVPTNLIEEWTKRDSQAAFEYAVAITQIDKWGSQSPLVDYAYGIAASSPSEHTIRALHDLITKNEYEVSTNLLAERFVRSEYGEIFLKALEGVPADERDRMGLNAFGMAHGNGPAERMNGLRVFATPSARIDAVYRLTRQIPTHAEETYGHLKELGHSAMEIEWLRQELNKPK